MERPNLDNTLFWDFDLKNLDFRRSYLSVIKRILERGTEEEWEEMIRFYGREKVVNAIKNEIPYIQKFVVPKVIHYFSIPENEMKCFTQKRSRGNYWP